MFEPLKAFNDKIEALSCAKKRRKSLYKSLLTQLSRTMIWSFLILLHSVVHTYYYFTMQNSTLFILGILVSEVIRLKIIYYVWPILTEIYDIMISDCEDIRKAQKNIEDIERELSQLSFINK